MKQPLDIQIIGNELAIRWNDDSESYFPMEKLRAASPSADMIGEPDVLGQRHGGTSKRDYPGVLILRFERVGNYALRFDFSDGHRTGIFSFEYLLDLERKFSV